MMKIYTMKQTFMLKESFSNLGRTKKLDKNKVRSKILQKNRLTDKTN